jgi:hypothetical protein
LAIPRLPTLNDLNYEEPYESRGSRTVLREV